MYFAKGSVILYLNEKQVFDRLNKMKSVFGCVCVKVNNEFSRPKKRRRKMKCDAHKTHFIYGE